MGAIIMKSARPAIWIFKLFLHLFRKVCNPDKQARKNKEQKPFIIGKQTTLSLFLLQGRINHPVQEERGLYMTCHQDKRHALVPTAAAFFLALETQVSAWTKIKTVNMQLGSGMDSTKDSKSRFKHAVVHNAWYSHRQW